MNIYEKAGDILANIAQLVVGGVILTNVIQEDFDGTTIYLIAGIITL
jgi:Mg2+/citrate symporter